MLTKSATYRRCLGQAIAEQRGSRLQQELSWEAGFQPNRWSEYELGKKYPERILPLLAEVLGCSVEALETRADALYRETEEGRQTPVYHLAADAEVHQQLGRLIRRLRNRQSRQALAKKAGLDDRRWTAIEAGEATAGKDLPAIAVALGHGALELWHRAQERTSLVVKETALPERIAALVREIRYVKRQLDQLGDEVRDVVVELPRLIQAERWAEETRLFERQDERASAPTDPGFPDVEAILRGERRDVD